MTTPTEPTLPAAADHDLAEQQQTPTRDEAPNAPAAVPLGTPEADAVEQAQPAAPGEHATDRAADRDLPLESDAADAAEQSVVVAVDEDEYR